MADPTPVEIAGNTSTTATTTVNFTAQTAGRVLILTVAADNYRTASGSGRPESTGWTPLHGQEGNLGHYTWYKISAGSETSVQYTLTGAARSAYSLASLDEMDASPLGATNTSATGVTSNQPTPSAVAAVTPTAGSRWCVVACVGTTGANTSGPYTWAGGYTKLSERYHTAGYRPGTTIATRTLDGGSSVTGTVAFTATGVEQVYSSVAAWKVAAAGGSSFSRPFRRNPSRGLIMRGKR